MGRRPGCVVRIEGQVGEVTKCVRQARVGQLVLDASTSGRRSHEAAVPQTCEVIGDVGAGETQVVRQVCGERRPIQQGNEDAPSSLIRQRSADSSERVQVDGRSERSHPITIQPKLYLDSSPD